MIVWFNNVASACAVTLSKNLSLHGNVLIDGPQARLISIYMVPVSSHVTSCTIS